MATLQELRKNRNPFCKIFIELGQKIKKQEKKENIMLRQEQKARRI